MFAPLPQPLSYTIPPHLAAVVVPGGRVRVPLGRRSAIGVVITLREAGEEQWELKPVVEYLDQDVPAFDPASLAFIQRRERLLCPPAGAVHENRPARRLDPAAGACAQAGGQPIAVLRVSSAYAARRSRPCSILSLPVIAPILNRSAPAFPSPYALLKRLEEKGLIVREEHVQRRDPFTGLEAAADSAPSLSGEQADPAVAAICASSGPSLQV